MTSVVRRRRVAAPETEAISAQMISVRKVCALMFCAALIASTFFAAMEPASAQAVGAASTVVTQPPTTSTTVKKKARRVVATVPATVVRVVTAKESIAPAAAPASAGSASADDVWAKLRKCEAGGRYDINTGNGYYGAYQFALSTWRRLGYEGYPHEAPPAVQDEAAQRLQAAAGWGQWPACSRKLGLR